VHESVLGPGIPTSTRNNLSSEGPESWVIKEVCPHVCTHVHSTQQQPSATATCMSTAQATNGQPWW